MALISMLAVIAGAPAIAQKKVLPKAPVYLEKDGRLAYTADAKGNRIPDFSYCGYKAAEAPIPNALVKVVVPLRSGDATNAVQSALDYVASLPLTKDGLRGAVLLQKGRYEISGTLHLSASGVVLRGSGTGAGGTLILGTGTSRETLIRIAGRNNKIQDQEQKIDDPYVRVGAAALTIPDVSKFKVGDQVTVRRPSTAGWIKEIGAEHFGGGITALGWKAGTRDIFWDRTIKEIKGSQIILDVPLTTALDSNYGAGYVSAYHWKGRIVNTGIENLELASTYDTANPKDEAHRWMAITIENARDAWVRQLNFKHFAGSAVAVLATAARITVEDCKSLDPVSERGGQRRNTFITSGQQTLFQRLYSAYGYHDFSTGFCAAGPNAFVECKAYMPFSFSGATDSWASGVLFDIVNIDGQAALSFMNRGQDGMGAGWAAANSVFWQCSAARIDCYQPPGAQNWSFGSWAQFAGDGYWDSSNEQIKPRSLYYAQLQDRLGNIPPVFLMPVPTEASSSPSAETAAELTKLAIKPAQTLEDFIDQAASRTAIPVNDKGIKTIDQIGLKNISPVSMAPKMTVSNGWLVRGAALVSGGRQDVQWWTGSARPYALKGMRAHITRFVPGQTGKGLTDDLDAVTDSMKADHTVAIDHNYALWYERRRDDHERVRRMDGDVWPPFYELPFARSGQGTAYDGLSKYDLTKYNQWYWARLKQFADLADHKGLLLLHQNYFQHNIIEAGAHYADFPWRTANNINDTGFPEPVPYAGDKRIFMAEQFYDISNPVRRRIHEAYIRECLDNFKDNSGVIQFIGAEFTGPLHFVQFWIDTIRNWEKETGKKALIALSTTKDVQDAILADPERAAVVDMIDIRYWHYQADGKAYAPPGGQSLAPRQQARLFKPKKTSFEQVYRAVLEYRQKFPGKAVSYSADNFDHQGWAALMAGGSLAGIPEIANTQFNTDVAGMLPAASQYMLESKGKSYLIYLLSGKSATLDLPAGNYRVRTINPATGSIEKKESRIKGNFNYQNQSKLDQVIWISKN
ncbi:DUF6298 domain-containing protein [Pedobacter sp. MC2016-15]|uniref:DUF6298 domain-containing protein n=1 Tax=Pedobacter sp. MC2016-15 TaxID=2994473 RepID=UPI002246B6E9|nr:DUF6298 domain-containing protein [Pedobacter sp. MC2016-15]MCX2480439.1 DUF6298 domain-containing protein [Pedobacter sp. MC2016-15]